MRKSVYGLLKACEIVNRQKVINMGERGLHATHARLVTILVQPGVEPDETVTAPPEAGELGARRLDRTGSRWAMANMASWIAAASPASVAKALSCVQTGSERRSSSMLSAGHLQVSYGVEHRCYKFLQLHVLNCEAPQHGPRGDTGPRQFGSAIAAVLFVAGNPVGRRNGGRK
jgi:hypothetical protein